MPPPYNTMGKLLLIDNFDSFTYNLLHLIKMEYNGDVKVVRNNQLNSIDIDSFNAIVISPGPGNPQTTPDTMMIIDKCYGNIPILGVCLGMQCLNEFKGGKTVKAPYPIHGKKSIISVTNSNSILFNGIPTTFEVGRYHSLQCVIMSDDLKVTARSEDDIPMAIEDKKNKAFGVQFHPESFLSDYGRIILKNFINQVSNAD